MFTFVTKMRSFFFFAYPRKKIKHRSQRLNRSHWKYVRNEAHESFVSISRINKWFYVSMIYDTNNVDHSTSSINIGNGTIWELYIIFFHVKHDLFTMEA